MTVVGWLLIEHALIKVGSNNRGGIGGVSDTFGNVFSRLRPRNTDIGDAGAKIGFIWELVGEAGSLVAWQGCGYVRFARAVYSIGVQVS